MKKSNLTKGISIIAIALVFGACKKDNSQRSSSGSQVKFGISADNSASSLNSSVNGGAVTNATTSATVNWTSAVANIAYFKFEAKTKNIDIEIKTRSLLNVDLFATTPPVIGATIDTGTYREIEIKVILAKTNTSAIPLTLKGSFTTPGGAIVPVEFDFNDDAEIKAEAQNVTVDGKTDWATTIKLHLNRLLLGITPAALDAAVRTGGTIIISSKDNVTIYNKIIANFPSSGEDDGFHHHEGGDNHGGDH